MSIASYAGAGAFANADHFVDITIEFIPDPEVIAHKLFEIASDLEDMAAPLALSQQISVDDFREHFTKEQAPNGEAWKEWSEVYAAQPPYPGKGPGSGILKRSGKLMTAATNPSNFEITPREVFFVGSDIPDYGWWNNFGAERSSGGDGYSIPKSAPEVANLASLEGISHDEAHRMLNTQEGGNTLPARQWLGLSDSAEVAIIRTFDQWFSGTVAFYTTSRGRIGRRHSARGAGGRFA